MKKKDFSDQYKDPRWQKKRLEIMQRDEFICCRCSDNSSEMNVHHKKYIKDRDLWDYDSKYLITLCNDCHKEVHLLKDKINDIISDVPPLFLDELCNLLPAIVRLGPGEQTALKNLLDKLVPEFSDKKFYEF